MLELFELCEEEPREARPAPLPEVAGPQDRVQRHFVEQITENFVLVQITDVPVKLIFKALSQDRVHRRRFSEVLQGCVPGQSSTARGGGLQGDLQCVLPGQSLTARGGDDLCSCWRSVDVSDSRVYHLQCTHAPRNGCRRISLRRTK